MADPPALAVGDEPEASEVHLELSSGRRVGDPDRHVVPSRPTALDTEAGQGARRDLHSLAGEQDADLGDGEVVLQPGLDPRLFAQQHPPGLAVAIGTVRADPLDHLADQLVAQLLLAAGALNSKLDGSGDVAPDRLSIDADPVGDRAFALTSQPAPQRLFDLDHRYLPKRHGASSPAASEAQPNVFSAGVGGPSGWSHNWQRGWSHVTGKTSDQLVPCGWQTTDQCRGSPSADSR